MPFAESTNSGESSETGRHEDCEIIEDVSELFSKVKSGSCVRQELKINIKDRDRIEESSCFIITQNLIKDTNNPLSTKKKPPEP